jgi:hypothetical protein
MVGRSCVPLLRRVDMSLDTKMLCGCDVSSVNGHIKSSGTRKGMHHNCQQEHTPQTLYYDHQRPTT